MFLCWMDSSCYVHQYHFWSTRDNRTPIPTYKYRELTASANTYAYHTELEHHFNWIWNNASISLSEFLEGECVGVDESTYKTAVKNIYTEPLKARNRITYLLDKAKEVVFIQGVSLKSYFEPGPLRDCLSRLIDAGKVKIFVLLLDPASEQAKYRSYRESLFEVPDQTFKNYISTGDHESSELWDDTNLTMRRIRQMIGELRRRKSAGWKLNLTVAFYDTAPACFLLKIDDHMLAEQYHYGKVAPRGTRDILGKDMPLFEYAKEPEELYKRSSNPLRMPYGLLDDHLKFVLAQASVQEIEQNIAHQEHLSDS